MHILYLALLSPTINKKIGKFIFARVCSPEIVPLCPGCKGMTPKERPAEGLCCAGGKTLVYIEEGREMTAC